MDETQNHGLPSGNLLQLGHVPLAGWIFYGQDFISLPASHLLHPAFVMAQPPAQAG